MASSLCLITPNLFTKSVIPSRPAVVSASRSLSIVNGTARQRSYTTMPPDDFYDQSCPKMLSPKISSIYLDMNVNNSNQSRYIVMYINLLEVPSTCMEVIVTGRDDGPEKKGIRACAEHTTFQYLIQDKIHNDGLKLLDNTSGDVKKDTKDGIVKVTPPYEDEFRTNIMANILANDIIASFRDITTKCSWPYLDMFNDRTIICKRLCPLITRMSPINSFELKKSGRANSLNRIDMELPGRSLKLRLTIQGLRVSLKMDGLKREDVKTYFYYDTFLIEGIHKTWGTHYIAGIQLPKDILKKHNMIKREIKDDVFYAIIPCMKKRRSGSVEKLNDLGN